MIAHPSDDLAARSTVAFCRAAAAASDQKPDPMQIVRDALIQARSVLNTSYRDTPEDLAKPERASVIERKVALITEALAVLGDTPSHATVFRVGGAVERYPLG